ncbi:MAG: A24 family peptidase [Pseudomonadota bacterium]
MTDAERARIQTLSLVAVLLLVGLAAQILYPYYRPVWATAGLLAVFTALIWYDFRHMILPDPITLPLIAAGLGWTVWSGGSLTVAVTGGAVGYLLVRLINVIWQARSGMDGMGLGDGKLLAAAGTWLGAFGLPATILIGSGTALLLVLLSGGGRAPNRHKRIAFGPFIALGFWACWVFPIVPVI